jgi:hypothetical protein
MPTCPVADEIVDVDHEEGSARSRSRLLKADPPRRSTRWEQRVPEASSVAGVDVVAMASVTGKTTTKHSARHSMGTERHQINSPGALPLGKTSAPRPPSIQQRNDTS